MEEGAELAAELAGGADGRVRDGERSVQRDAAAHQRPAIREQESAALGETAPRLLGAAVALGRAVADESVDAELLALEVIAEVGPGGHYLTHAHTLAHYREELWVPGKTWTRDTYDAWASHGEKDMGQRAAERVEQILKDYQPEPIDPLLSVELDRILKSARGELVD